MQLIDVSKQTIGVNVNDEGKASINIWAPKAEKLSIVFDNEELPPTKKELGYWYCSTDEIREGAKYKVKVDDKSPLPDPASLSQPDGVHGYSEVIKPSGFLWSDTEWINRPLEEYIIYELHTGTFTE